MHRDLNNLAIHRQAEAILTEACVAAGWRLGTYQPSYWGTGERHDLVRAQLRELTSSPSGLGLLTAVRERSPHRHLALQFEAAAVGDRCELESIVRVFVMDLARRLPELGDQHRWSLEPAGVRDMAGLARRLFDLRSFFSTQSWGTGLYLADSVAIDPSWDTGHIHVKLVRDEGGRNDEDLAARQLSNALARTRPELASGVTIRGVYCK